MDEVEIYSIGNFVGISALPPEEAALARAYVEALVEVAYRGGPQSELDAAADRARATRRRHGARTRRGGGPAGGHVR